MNKQQIVVPVSLFQAGTPDRSAPLNPFPINPETSGFFLFTYLFPTPYSV
jgi:hypothetical protein